MNCILMKLKSIFINNKEGGRSHLLYYENFYSSLDALLKEVLYNKLYMMCEIILMITSLNTDICNIITYLTHFISIQIILNGPSVNCFYS